jgi:DNA modification methylase
MLDMHIPITDTDSNTSNSSEHSPVYNAPFKKDYVLQTDAVAAKWQVQLGDVWQLDKHRVVCGDCTDITTIQAKTTGYDLLCAGTILLSDPPYNVGKEYVDKNLTKQQYIDWCAKWTGYLPATKILFTGIKRLMWWGTILGDPQWIISWVKRNGQGRTTLGGVNKWDAVLLYNVVPDKGVDYVDILNDNKEHLKERGQHPTPKPVALCQYLLDRFAKQHTVVFDPFLGSGTTLLAAHNLGKTCVGIEINPLFVAGGLERWLTKTNIQPVRLYNIYD